MPQKQTRLPLSLLRRYLLATGWRLNELPTAPNNPLSLAASADGVSRAFLEGREGGIRNFDVFTLPSEESSAVELVVPHDTDSDDYQARIQGALGTLSQLEDRPPDQVAESVRTVGFDVVRSRLPDAVVLGDAIQLATATRFVNGIKDLMASTATTEIRPLPFFGRVNKEAKTYSDRCHFGHTFRGSFGFTVESPLVPMASEDLFGKTPALPFERRVIQRLANGIQQICDAAETENVDLLIQGVSNGFGANGCERFASLIEDSSDNGVTFDFRFSPELRVTNLVRQDMTYFVGQKHAVIAKQAAKSLRGSPINLPTDVFGRVVRLQSESDPSDVTATTGEREISVAYSSEDYGKLHLRIVLSPDEYLVAVEAHRQGRPVLISGTLVHEGRFWFLRNPSRLTVPFQRELGLE